MTMQEIARVTLENEMDLILAHKRSMKLAELTGLSLASQTTFATAVSEVSRNTIDSGKSGCLILSVESEHRNKYIVACIVDTQENSRSREGLQYAKRLVDKYHVSNQNGETSIELFYAISPNQKLDINKLDEWRSLFRNEPSISPYEEIKRKNEQLQELSERLQKSETQYKILTNSLPLTIFSLDTNGQLIYANEWLLKYTGETCESLNSTQWKNVVHPDEYDAFSLLLKSSIARDAHTIRMQARLLSNDLDTYLWHQVSLTPLKNDKKELQYWIGYIVDIHSQKVYEETLRDNIELKQTQAELRENQQTLETIIAELNRSNHELQQFAFVASHDLQEPVRKLLYYSDYLLGSYAGTMDDRGMGVLKSMQTASQRMRHLIQDLLLFSQINKEHIHFKNVNLDTVIHDACQDLEMAIEEKKAVLHIQSLPVIQGDARMLRQLFENLISNSLKYSKHNEAPVITITCTQKEDAYELAFADNGIGFDEKYLPQMFTLFQRLHTREEYEGTGLGLAICRKIVELHQGKIWAHAAEGAGATFFISLPQNRS